MSNTPSPGTLIADDDPIVLNTNLDRLVGEYAKVKAALVAAKAANDELAMVLLSEAAKKLVHDQISIISRLRRTSSGPAKVGGKRAKKAPIDLQAALSALMKPNSSP